jgi:hypothetical protein
MISSCLDAPKKFFIPRASCARATTKILNKWKPAQFRTEHFELFKSDLVGNKGGLECF